MWFDLDSASLTELPQRYERRSEASYWYEAPTVPYQASSKSRPTVSSGPTRVSGGWLA